MPLRMWMLDLAREQSPSLDHLRKYLRLTQESGFDALGLYFESRFAHPATPFAHGVGCVTPDDVRALQAEFPSVGIVPFLNLLGHCEQLLYTEEGKRYREELLKGMQACPTNEEFRELCRRKVADTLAVFSSQVIHIGGDETWQLGSCDACRRRQRRAGRRGYTASISAPSPSRSSTRAARLRSGAICLSSTPKRSSTSLKGP